MTRPENKIRDQRQKTRFLSPHEAPREDLETGFLLCHPPTTLIFTTETRFLYPHEAPREDIETGFLAWIPKDLETGFLAWILEILVISRKETRFLNPPRGPRNRVSCVDPRDTRDMRKRNPVSARFLSPHEAPREDRETGFLAWILEILAICRKETRFLPGF